MLFIEIRKSEKGTVCVRQNDEFSSLPIRHISSIPRGTNFIPLTRTGI